MDRLELTEGLCRIIALQNELIQKLNGALEQQNAMDEEIEAVERQFAAITGEEELK